MRSGAVASVGVATTGEHDGGHVEDGDFFRNNHQYLMGPQGTVGADGFAGVEPFQGTDV